MNANLIEHEYEPHSWEPETKIIARPIGRDASEVTTRIMRKSSLPKLEIDLGWLEEYAAMEEQVA